MGASARQSAATSAFRTLKSINTSRPKGAQRVRRWRVSAVRGSVRSQIELAGGLALVALAFRRFGLRLRPTIGGVRTALAYLIVSKVPSVVTADVSLVTLWFDQFAF